MRWDVKEDGERVEERYNTKRNRVKLRPEHGVANVLR